MRICRSACSIDRSIASYRFSDFSVAAVAHYSHTLKPMLYKVTGVWETRIDGDMFLGLYTDAPDGSVELGAAESHTVSDDGLTHTFTIREGLKWSDGVPVTANDFVFAWRRFVSPANAAEFASLMEVVVNAHEIIAGEMNPSELGVEAPDDRTFVVHLTHPRPTSPIRSPNTWSNRWATTGSSLKTSSPTDPSR